MYQLVHVWMLWLTKIHDDQRCPIEFISLYILTCQSRSSLFSQQQPWEIWWIRAKKLSVCLQQQCCTGSHLSCFTDNRDASRDSRFRFRHCHTYFGLWGILSAWQTHQFKELISRMITSENIGRRKLWWKAGSSSTETIDLESLAILVRKVRNLI